MKENVKQDTQTLNNLTSTLTNDNIKLRLEELESEVLFTVLSPEIKK